MNKIKVTITHTIEYDADSEAYSDICDEGMKQNALEDLYWEMDRLSTQPSLFKEKVKVERYVEDE